MRYPNLSYIPKSREMTSTFMGYNHNLSCQEGEFFDMKNITCEFFPVLSPRHKRAESKTFTDLNGIADKEDLVWVDDGILYIDNEPTEVTLSKESNMLPKRIYTMGAYIVIFPDKVWYNTKDKKHGNIVAEKNIETGTEIKFTVIDGDEKGLTWHDEKYYSSHTPNDGDYMMVTKDGKSSLRIWYKALSMWSTVATTYIKIESDGIDSLFEEDDGIKITIDNTDAKWSYAEKIFVNKDEEDENKHSLNTYVHKKGENYIIIVGLLDENKTFTNLPMVVERPCPDMPHITECQNRLWGCSEDGHEVYCCKQGSVTNWNYYRGISLDSWAATVGSDGKFTGAITFNQNPIFFKENMMLRINVSGSGAHSYRETPCPGVQMGSEKSLQLINSAVYYKGTSGVYVYDGSVPQVISQNLGVPTYKDAVGGSVKYRYYLSMKDADDKASLFVYDTQKGLWTKEDDTYSEYFVTHKDDLFIVKDNKLISVYGSALYEPKNEEGKVPWLVESGFIGFTSPDNKYCARINLRMSLEVGSYAFFLIEYDSSGIWENVFSISGKGTRTFTMPIKTHRCDHFRFKVVGVGECKLFSITKEVEEGSDGQ